MTAPSCRYGRDPVQVAAALRLGRYRVDRTYAGAPLSVAELASAVLEPLVSVVVLLVLHAAHGITFGRWSIAAALMIISLTFPGRWQLDLGAREAALEILRHWTRLLGILALCVYVTGGLPALNLTLAAEWAVLAPVVHWCARMLLVAALQRRALALAPQRTAVIVGGGALGERTARALASLGQGGTRVAGIFDDRHVDRLEPFARDQRLGGLADVARYVGKLGIRAVYITLPAAPQQRISALVESLQATTAAIHVVPDVLGVEIVQGRLIEIDGLAVVGICESPFTGINALAKRGSDIAIAAALLLLSSPLWLVLALAIRLGSAGPVLERLRLSGRHGDEIIVYRFRTTALSDGRASAAGTTSRATAVGCWIERHRLAELPQLVNVLQGRLSMVGPRACPLVGDAAWRNDVPGYMVRHKVRPGVTGWAQIHRGIAGNDPPETMRERLSLDLEYMRHWSLALDWYILVRSLARMLRHP